MASCKATTKCFTDPKKWRCPQSRKLCYTLYCDPCERLAFHSPSSTMRSGRNYQIPSRRWMISQRTERLVWPLCVSPESTFKVVTMAAREDQALRPRVCLLFPASEWRSNSSPFQSGAQQQAAKVLSWGFSGHKTGASDFALGVFTHSWDALSGSTAAMLRRSPIAEPYIVLHSRAPAEFLTRSSHQLPGMWGNHLKCPAHQVCRRLKPQLTSEGTTRDPRRDSHPGERSQPTELGEATKWWL